MTLALINNVLEAITPKLREISLATGILSNLLYHANFFQLLQITVLVKLANPRLAYASGHQSTGRLRDQLFTNECVHFTPMIPG